MLSKTCCREKKAIQSSGCFPGMNSCYPEQHLVTFCSVRVCAYYCIVHGAQDTLSDFVYMNI